MDRASFELIGNVGKLEIKPLKGDRHLAIVSVATSERWKAESGDWNEDADSALKAPTIPGNRRPGIPTN